MLKTLFLLLVAFLMLSGCVNQVGLFPKETYHGTPYSLDAIAYEYSQQRSVHD
jgi:hypothetical protein